MTQIFQLTCEILTLCLLHLAGNFEFLDEEDSNEEDEEADYSEDEGCFVITSVPQSNEETEPEEEGEEQEVTNKVRKALIRLVIED